MGYRRRLPGDANEAGDPMSRDDLEQGRYYEEGRVHEGAVPVESWLYEPLTETAKAEINRLDSNAAIRFLRGKSLDQAADWIDAHRAEYTRGVIEGFVVVTAGGTGKRIKGLE